MHTENVQTDRDSDTAIDKRQTELPAEDPVLSRWPFVERRRRTTDRRQHNSANVFLHYEPGNERRASAPLPTPDVSHLCTAREQQIVQLLVQGMSNKRIAQQLGIVEDTVKKHLQHIYDKLGVRRRTLVMLGIAVKPADGEANTVRRELTG